MCNLLCPSCNKKIKKGSAFCSYCGADLSDNDNTEEAPQAPSAALKDSTRKLFDKAKIRIMEFLRSVVEPIDPKLSKKEQRRLKKAKEQKIAILVIGMLTLIGLILLPFAGCKPEEISQDTNDVTTVPTTLSASVSYQGWDEAGSPLGVYVDNGFLFAHVFLQPNSDVLLTETVGEYDVYFDSNYYLMSDGSLTKPPETKHVSLDNGESTSIVLSLQSLDYAEMDYAQALSAIERAAFYIEDRGDTLKAQELKSLALELLDRAHALEDSSLLARPLRVHFLDVGQGNSTFIELPTGETMLIDGGTASCSSFVSDYIRNLGHERIDYLVATHPHEDHIGGLISIIGSFEIGEIWAPKVTHTTNTYEDFLGAIASNNMTVRTAVAGKEIITLFGLRVSIVSPSASASYSDLNDWSAVISLVYKDTSFLFPSDASSQVVASGYSGHIDVLEVSHHGSSTGTSSSLVTTLSPAYAVISCGEGNSYGHPADSVISLLSGTKLFRTDVQGTIVFESDGSSITVDKEPYVKEAVQEVVSAPASTVSSTNNSTTNNSSVTVYITNTGRKYHVDGCRYLSNSQIPISLADAIAQGYEPCSVCRPPH